MNEKPIEREHILLAPSAGDRRYSDGLLGFIASALNKNSDPYSPHRFSTVIASNIRGYAAMRNFCADRFLKSNCSRLWFLDDDIMPPLNIFQLLETDADICVAPYPFIGNMRPVYLHYADPVSMTGLVEPKSDGKALDVTGVGMGCTLIRRVVLEDTRMRYSTKYIASNGKEMDQKDEKGSLPPIFRFHLKPDGQAELGEDFDFSMRAKRLGYSVKVRPDIPCDHLKRIGLNEARKIVEDQVGEDAVSQLRSVMRV